MRNFRLDDESGHQETLFSWAAYRTGLRAGQAKTAQACKKNGKTDK